MVKPQQPEDNLPGHHPEREQDKPSGEAFVQKLHEHAREVAEEEAEVVAETVNQAPHVEVSEPEPPATVAGEVLRATAGALRKVRESLPGS